MKVQCERCREIVDIGDFRSSEQGIEITCLACGETYAVASCRGRDLASAEAQSSPGARPGAKECPKCGEPVADDAGACARCGLARSHFVDFEGVRTGPGSEALAERWSATCKDWSSPDAHDAFIDAAFASHDFSYAARSYRAILRERPGDEIAGQRLEAVRRRAEAAILETAVAGRYRPEGREPYKAIVVMLLVLVALAAGGMLYAVALHDNGDESERRAAPSAAEPAVRGKARTRQ